MSARGTMHMRAVVERDQAAADPFGGSAAPSWQTLHASLPCRMWHHSGRHVFDGDKITELTERRMVVPKGTDITVKDRITRVEDRLGNVLFDGPIRIDVVGYRRGHLAITLEAVR